MKPWPQMPVNPYSPTSKELVDFQMRPNVRLRVPQHVAYGFWWFTDLSPECKAEMNQFVRSAATKKCLLDVGAYHGAFAFTFAALGPDKVAHAFEPSPMLWDALNLIRCENPALDVHTYQLALSDEEKVHDARTEFNSHVVLSPGKIPGTNCSGPDDPGVVVRSVTGDSMDINPDIIKIDVEGHEVRVVRGLVKTIHKNRPIIFIELHGLRIVDDGCNLQELVDLMKPLDYELLETWNGFVRPLEHMLLYPVGSEIQRVVLCPTK